MDSFIFLVRISVMSLILRVFVAFFIFSSVGFEPTLVHAQSSSKKETSSKKKKKKKSRKSKKKRKKSFKTQPGLVVVDGATVYNKPNFDSDVLDYLDQGKKIKISKKNYPGAGGLGVFYKVRLKGKRRGYVVDTEVRPEGSAQQASESTTIFDSFDDPAEPQAQPTFQAPIYFTKYIGGGATFANLTETYEGKKLSAFTPMVSFKLTGPGIIIDGPPIDVEVNIGTSAPTYYNKFSVAQSGLFTLASLSLLGSLAEYPKGLLYYGFGLMMIYEKFEVLPKSGSPIIDSEEVRGGVALSMGYAHKLGSRYLVRAEGKYYYENEGYIAAGISLQRSY